MPEFEQEPGDELRPYCGVLALREEPREFWSNFIGPRSGMPFGAGMVLRRRIAELYCADQAARKGPVLGRRGSNLMSSEDLEISHVAIAAGWGIGVFPLLELTHLIPKHRTTREYLLRLAEEIDYSNSLLQLLRTPHALDSYQYDLVRNFARAVVRVLRSRGLQRTIEYRHFRAIRRSYRTARLHLLS
jgi:hypothetical protein